MASIRAKGIVIRQSDYGEGHRLLDIFTEGLGIVKAVSYGALKSKGAAAASTQLLCYGDFTLYKGGGRFMSVNSADIRDSFYPVTEDIVKLALTVYMSDITYDILGENNADERILSLYLNSIYAMAYKNEDPQKVKTVYELKLMTAGGYMPSLYGCTACGAREEYAFSFEKGGAVCKKCGAKNSVRINGAVLSALRYIVGCEDKKMLSFSATEQLLEYLNRISENYISRQLDRKYKSLEYYNTVLMS